MDDHDSIASATQVDDLSTIEDDTRSLGEFSGTTLNEGTLLAEELVKRCDKLLGELEAYQSYLAQNKQGHNVEVKPFRNSIAAELKSLEKVSDFLNPSYVFVVSTSVMHTACCGSAASY